MHSYFPYLFCVSREITADEITTEYQCYKHVNVCCHLFVYLKHVLKKTLETTVE